MADKLIQHHVEEIARKRAGMIEGLAKEFLAATGLTPDRVELVEQRHNDGKTTWHFQEKATKVGTLHLNSPSGYALCSPFLIGYVTNNHDLVTCEACKRHARLQAVRDMAIDTTLDADGKPVLKRDVQKGGLFTTTPEHLDRAAKMIGAAQNGMLPDAHRDAHLERLKSSGVLQAAPEDDDDEDEDDDADEPEIVEKPHGATNGT